MKQASGLIVPNESKLSWLISCFAHTMNRVTKSIKNNITKDNDTKVKFFIKTLIDKNNQFNLFIKVFYGYWMSLLLKCQTLECIKNVF